MRLSWLILGNRLRGRTEVQTPFNPIIHIPKDGEPVIWEVWTKERVVVRRGEASTIPQAKRRARVHFKRLVKLNETEIENRGTPSHA